jgi:hypothetical protein
VVLEGIKQVVSMLFADVFDTEVIDGKGEANGP